VYYKECGGEGWEIGKMGSCLSVGTVEMSEDTPFALH
jgi:hypothetical protein